MTMGNGNGVPYENATSGTKAREEIQRILQRFGCSKVGFMDDFDTHTLLLQFEWRSRPVQLRASAEGWASMWLRANPWTESRRSTEREWKEKAHRQGSIAVNSVLRDWVKGQVTAIESGMSSFDTVFMPYMVLPSGQTLAEKVRELELLPAPSAGVSSG